MAPHPSVPADRSIGYSSGQAAGAPPLTWARKAALATGLARGVAYLHSLAPPIIHRDLKPGNCLLDGAGTLKVAGLGSRLVARPSRSRRARDLWRRGRRRQQR